jgi:Tfp pilus assembly protein PilN
MKHAASFLPEDFVVETRERRTGVLAAVLFPVMVIAVFAAFLVTNQQWNDVRAAQAAIDTETERVAREIAEMKNLERIRTHMDAKAELARGLLEPVPRSVLLAVLTNTMPSRVSLTSFELRTEVVKPPKSDASATGKAGARAGAKAGAGSTKGAKSGEAGQPIATPTPPAPLRRTNLIIVGVAPSLLEVGRWMTALEKVPIFASVRLELMEEKVIDGRGMSEFRMGIRIDPESDIRAWSELARVRAGELPASIAASLEEDHPFTFDNASATSHASADSQALSEDPQ